VAIAVLGVVVALTGLVRERWPGMAAAAAD
jgi:hypothetical protein